MVYILFSVIKTAFQHYVAFLFQLLGCLQILAYIGYFLVELHHSLLVYMAAMYHFFSVLHEMRYLHTPVFEVINAGNRY